jgi:hypothetical protein
MRSRELSLHREAVLIQAWRSGKIYWFAERARKYGQIETRSIWAGSIAVVSRRGHESIKDEAVVDPVTEIFWCLRGREACRKG